MERALQHERSASRIAQAVRREKGENDVGGILGGMPTRARQMIPLPGTCCIRAAHIYRRDGSRQQ